ncbi:MAG: response regulator [Candidatus Omnitrophica bacterium]|nr:response regulator [Candidatus Omnitrophota bacterium]
MADFVTAALGTSEVAHALKAPLITTEKALSLLREPGTGPLNDTQKKFLAIAERNLQLVTKVLGDFLDTARLDAGTMRLLRTPGSVDETVRRVVDEARAAAAAKGLALTYRAVDGTPPAAFDPVRLGQAIAHLLDHALGTTPPAGSITVEVKPRDPWVEILIVHTGAGLYPEELDQLFERRLPADGKADAHSFGLGLSLAKGIIELHQGRLTVTSQAGVGTTWTVWLPIERGAVASGPRTGPARLLVVDDDPDFRDTVGAALRAKGYAVLEAGRGDEALAILQRESVAIVFLDIHLPPTDGLTVLKQIRAMQRNLPVILITAFPEDQTIARARQLGISGFFTKEGGYPELMALIDVALRRHQGL